MTELKAPSHRERGFGMAYMHGNLAVQPKQRTEERQAVAQKKKVAVRRKPLPVQEKLLYLFTILICVVVAGVIIMRYAQIYQMNLEIRQLTIQMGQMNEQINELRRQVETKSDPQRIREQASLQGMVPGDGTEIIAFELQAGGSQTASALNE